MTILNYIYSNIHSDNQKSHIKLLYIVAFFSVIFQILFTAISHNLPDTASYYSAGENFANGTIDSLRTPLYSLLCFWSKNIFGLNGSYVAISLLQTIIFLLSVYSFYKICKYLINSNIIVMTTSIIYALHPAIVGWTRSILTESLAISGSVFLLYALILFVEKPNWLRAMIINIITFLLIMHRPAFAYLLPIIFLFFIYFIVKNRKTAYIVGLAGIIAVCASFTGYSYLFKQQYGIYAPSRVGDCNLYWVLRDYNLIETETISDIDGINTNELKKDIEENTEWRGILLQEKYGYKVFNKLVRKSLMQNKFKYIKYLFIRFISNNYPVGATTNTTNIINLSANYAINISFPILYIILLIYVLSIIFFIKKEKKVPESALFMLLCIAASLIMNFVLAPNAYDRLMAANYPYILIIIAQLANMITIKIKKIIIK